MTAWRSVFFEACEREYGYFRNAATGDYDKELLLASVMHSLSAGNADVWKAFQKDAVDALGVLLLKEYFRTAESGFVVEDRASRATAKSAVRMRTFVQVPLGGNVYSLKRRIDLTYGDLRSLEEFHEAKERSHAREVKWLRGVRAEMKVRGLTNDDDRISALVVESAA